MEKVQSFFSFTNNEFLQSIFEKEHLSKVFNSSMVYYIAINKIFRVFEISGWWVLKYFTKYFETKKLIPEIYHIFHGEFNC